MSLPPSVEIFFQILGVSSEFFSLISNDNYFPLLSFLFRALSCSSKFLVPPFFLLSITECPKRSKTPVAFSYIIFLLVLPVFSFQNTHACPLLFCVFSYRYIFFFLPFSLRRTLTSPSRFRSFLCLDKALLCSFLLFSFCQKGSFDLLRSPGQESIVLP